MINLVVATCMLERYIENNIKKKKMTNSSTAPLQAEENLLVLFEHC